MSSSRSSPKPGKKGSSDPSLLSFDLLYQLTYMATLASTGIPRDEIFARAANLPTTTARYFQEVEHLVHAMRYRYSEACRIVAERSDAGEVRGLLLRMSSYLASGEPERVFMANEARLQAQHYENLYEGALESLKKWTDAFAAMAVSSSLIVVVATVSTVIFSLGNAFIMGLVGLMVGINVLGVWVLWRAAPKEVKVLAPPDGLRAQRRARGLALVLAPASVVVGVMALAAGMSLGTALILASLVLLPAGFAASWFDRSIDRLDKDVGAFLRVLGSTATSVGTTPAEALDKLDMRSVANLAPTVRRLHASLRSRAKPELCWRRFVSETGSEVINRSVRVFTDGIGLGGDPEEVGQRSSELAVRLQALRDKRAQVAGTFGWLTLVMHVAIVFLLLFVVEVVGSFGNLVSATGVENLAAQGSAQTAATLTFNFGNMELLRSVVMPIVVILAFLYALAPKVAEGGYSFKLLRYLSFTLFLTGLAMVTTPKLGSLFFPDASFL